MTIEQHINHTENDTMSMTPIEKIVALLSLMPDVVIAEVLVPEQCALVQVGSDTIHITAEIQA